MSWHPNRHVVLVTLNTRQREGWRKGEESKEDREEEKGGEEMEEGEEEREEEEDHGSGLYG